MRPGRLRPSSSASTAPVSVASLFARFCNGVTVPLLFRINEQENGSRYDRSEAGKSEIMSIGRK